jgi:hypothetical protein
MTATPIGCVEITCGTPGTVAASSLRRLNRSGDQGLTEPGGTHGQGTEIDQRKAQAQEAGGRQEEMKK